VHGLLLCCIVRRSIRHLGKPAKSLSKKLDQSQRTYLEHYLTNKTAAESPVTALEVRYHPRCGSGLHTRDNISAGQFVIEYGGELITGDEARNREDNIYTNTTHSYLFFFRNPSRRQQWLCRDSTNPFPIYGLARYINHSRLIHNVEPHVLVDNNQCPRIVFIANQQIPKNSELLFDYGDRDTTSVRQCQWLND
jgi:SET domain